MSTTYEESTTTQSNSGGIAVNQLYLKSPTGGLLKIAEIVVDLIGFICASVWINWGPYGGAWVQFVTMSAFILTGLLFAFHVLGIIHKLPGPWPLIQLIFYAVYSLMMLIAGIVAASRGAWHSSVGATAFFVFVATILYILDTFLCFRDYQAGRMSSSTTGATTTTTTTTTTQQSYEVRAQY